MNRFSMKQIDISQRELSGMLMGEKDWEITRAEATPGGITFILIRKRPDK